METPLHAHFTRAIETMQEWHGDQVRKYSYEPYWTHPVTVAGMVAQHVPREEAILAALFHDVVEDTPFGPHDIFSFVTQHYPLADPVLVTDTVMDLTNRYEKELCPGLNRAERHRLETLRLSRISPFAQSIKYGDIAHNCQSIREFAPGYASQYLAEKKQILLVMDKGHHLLLKHAWEVVHS
ncbi:MAG: HD domain-containing protein [Saprospiraceae bacterium]|nr:HD domain-containing protein [Saprospiraceae bacterium]